MLCFPCPNLLARTRLVASPLTSLMPQRKKLWELLLTGYSDDGSGDDNGTGDGNGDGGSHGHDNNSKGDSDGDHNDDGNRKEDINW